MSDAVSADEQARADLRRAAHRVADAVLDAAYVLDRDGDADELRAALDVLLGAVADAKAASASL